MKNTNLLQENVQCTSKIKCTWYMYIFMSNFLHGDFIYSCLYRIPFYSGFGLESFYYSSKLTNTVNSEINAMFLLMRKM